jgi:hypothetical protein
MMWYNTCWGVTPAFARAGSFLSCVSSHCTIEEASYASIGNPLIYVDPTGHFWWMAIGAVVGAGIAYGAQVADNLHQGKDLGAALTTDINLMQVAEGAALGATAVLLAPAAVGVAADVLTGAGLALGSTELFGAGMAATGVAGTMAAEVYGVAAEETSGLSAEAALCFQVGTSVVVDDGQVPIETIEVGDQVLTFDPDTEATGYFTVTAVFSHERVPLQLWWG